ncbi:MAG: helix-turn-helix domain-containing protein [Alistipes sp.]|nr:helix-turn-helix domain-containing protein [Alistipes sp.]
MYTIDLEEFIIKNNLTQQELADILGVSQPYINNVVKGKSKLSSKKILELLQAGKYDTSMIKEVKKNQNLADDTVTMREVFNSIQQLVDTINSQQRTIESQQEELKTYRGGTAQKGEPAVNVDVG